MVQRYRNEIIYWFVLIFASLNFALAYVRLLYSPFSYEQYAHGLAPYPYQSRILMSRVFALCYHSRFLDKLSSHARFPLNLQFRFLLLGIAFVSIIIAVYFVRLSLKYLINNPEWARWSSLLVLFMAYYHYILDSASPFLYPYDLPSLAIFSVGTYLIFRRRWIWYYPLFILGTFNRETTCFLTVFLVVFELFPLQPSPVSYRKIAAHVFLQAGLWTAIRYYSSHFYGSHHTYFYWALRYNLHDGFTAKHWPDIFSSFGFLWIVYLLGFKSIPYKGLRWGAIILILWFVAMMEFGWIYEMRIYGELIPYMAICVSLIVWQWMKNNPRCARL